MDTIFGRLQEAERKCSELTQSLWAREWVGSDVTEQTPKGEWNVWK